MCMLLFGTYGIPKGYESQAEPSACESLAVAYSS